MTLAELRYLVTLAQEKHFGKAADACCVSQPTLSIAINKLETKLGVKVFERHHRDIRITAIGEKIIGQAQQALEAITAIKSIADNNKSQLDYPLKIGAIYTVAPYLFPKLIPKLNNIAPNMPLIVQEGFTSQLREKLQTGELDILFVSLPFTEAGVVTKTLYVEPFVALMRKDHPLAKKKTIHPDDLLEEDILLLGEGHCFRDQVLTICPHCNNSSATQHRVEGTSLETLCHMVASGLGMTVLPSTATQIAHYSNILCTRPFKTKSIQRAVALAWRASFPRTKAIDAIIQSVSKSNLATF